MTPLIVIVGETASGKSDLAMLLARTFDGEIIAADSWTVYKDFTIGTAKPSREDRLIVPHYMIDVADPTDGYSAALYKNAAQDAIKDISNRGKIPILVGGTGLYVDSVLFDYSFLPGPTLEQRQDLNALSLQQLFVRAQELGLPVESIDARNKRRVIRLIENEGRMPAKGALRQDTLIIGTWLDPVLLDSRIERRVDAMLAAGLEAEVHMLALRYGWDIEPMKGVGYREFREYFNQHQTLDETRERIIRNTRKLAKKQRTWFRRNKSIQWVNDPKSAVVLATTFLDNYHIQ